FYIFLVHKILLECNLFFFPHWVFVFLVLIAIFYDEESTHASIIYSAIFGLLIDIVYTDILGVYMFSYAVGIYIVYVLKKLLHTNFFVTFILTIVGISISEILISIIYSVICITYLNFDEYVMYRLIPTILSNVIFVIILYPLAKRHLMQCRDYVK